MTAGAPTDTTFYTDLVPMAQRLGMKPEDLLWVWASETGFDPTLSGGYRTISTMGHAQVVPDLLTEDEWTSLPTLTATAQLPFIERYYNVLHTKYLGGRNFKDTFEAYLANAAAGLLRYDGRYNPQTTMYGDPNAPANWVWQANWIMDNYPAALTASTSRGVPLTLSLAKTLVSEGVLKGWITLGDLKNFMLRASVGPFANDAIKRLHDSQNVASTSGSGVVPASYSTSDSSGDTYTPDFSQSFSDPAAPVDVRIAPDAPSKRSLLSWPEAIVLGGVLYFGLRWMRK